LKLYLLVISILLPAILPQCGFAAEVKESPVGLVLSPGGAKLLRANTETLLDARAGDLLFTGDGLREARFDAKQVKLKTGQITGEKPAQSCFLPQLVRVAVASQQHYGVSMTRGVDKPDALPTPRDKMPPQVVQALAPIDQALTADPKDVAAMIAAAALYENNNLPVNALVQYQAIREALADATHNRWRRRRPPAARHMHCWSAFPNSKTRSLRSSLPNAMQLASINCY
jgi:hypothetical protein